ncbi:4-(cytidine 5'-diphospho)-2-C-methyl-D-erythritol kinase [Psychrobacter pygoscelis]|uniref:4-(cytidine 5'-diphospho)-2-C-methyl-D-erythritol kinase n=1 Tax=Psychrobacter pygoscelis TaxID=2488563 RepID=UPI00103D868C|nr:4-(cytidine 5'-diphospho)-2-C-methyl-D-erythritol kinase [Psychrobacter pygoscelis]
MTASLPIYPSEPPTLTQFSPAKINLFLHITEKRADGYHELQTVFRLLNWGDTLRFWCRELLAIDLSSYSVSSRAQDSTSRNGGSQGDSLQSKLAQHITASGLVQLIGADSITHNPADNLIVRAAAALLSYVSRFGDIEQRSETLAKIEIAVEKVIPMGAGLGGGSSNAAATLIALNSLWQLGLSQQQLLEIGASIGADVPIFILHQDAIGEGIGERLTPVDLPAQRYLLLMPKAHISTAELFAHPKLQRNCPPLTAANIIQEQCAYLYQLLPPYHNVFEPVVRELSRAVDEALIYLEQLATELTTLANLPSQSIRARMTGSGSTVLLPLPNDLFDSSLASTPACHASNLDLDDHVKKADYPQHQPFQQWIVNAPCPAIIVDSLYRK